MTSTNPDPPLPVLARLRGVRKQFQRGGRVVQALDGVDFDLRAGLLVGLFGNNGAGKTTLTRLLTGTLDADGGSVELGGFDLRTQRAKAQALTGLCAADERSFYPRLSGLANLRLFGELRGVEGELFHERLGKLCEALQISDALLSRQFQTLSSGERQRLNITRGMLHEPAVLVIDEALRSADPGTVDRVSQLLCDYVSGGERSILYTGHEFQGVENLCQEIAVLDAGQLVVHGSRLEVLKLARPVWRLEFEQAEQALAVTGSDTESETVADLPASDERAARTRVAELLCDPGAGLRSASFMEHCSIRDLLIQVARGEAPRSADVGEARRDSGVLQLDLPPQSSAAALLRSLLRRDRLLYLSHRFHVVMQAGVMVLWTGLIYCVMRLLEPNSAVSLDLFHGDGFTYVMIGVGFLQLSHVCLTQMGSTLREEQLQGTMEIVQASGRSPLLLLAGSLLWPLCVSATMTGVLLAASAGMFGAKFEGANWTGVGLAALLAVVVFSCLGVISAAFVLAFKRGDPVAKLLGLATLLVGGTYFPVESLPDWLRPFGEAHPMTHALRAARMAGQDGVGVTDQNYLASMGILAGMAVVFAPLARWSYGRALRYARRTGGLQHS